MEPSDTGLDIDSAAADIAAGLFNDEPQERVTETAPQEEQTAPQTVDEYAEPPKSWAKEYHEHWAKIDQKARGYVYQREKQMLDGLEQYKQYNDFGKQLKPIYEPYKAYLQENGLDEVKATQYLLAAQHRLATGDNETRRQLIMDLAKSYNIDLAVNAASSPQNPELAPLINQINGIQSALQRQTEAQNQQVREKVGQEVNAFASDPAHEYFDEVAEDVAKFIGLGMPLQDAYEKAVWANPVTRQKQIEKAQTEYFEKQKAKAKEEAEAAKKGKSTNVRSRDTGKAPTEPLGSWDDTMKETLASIKARTH